MSLTRKHFTQLADVAGRMPIDSEAFALLVRTLADICEQENPRFDRKRFESTCSNNRSQSHMTVGNEKQQPTVFTTSKLKAGTYYVGDLCYILGDKNGYTWDHVLTETGFLGIYHPKTKQSLEPNESGVPGLPPGHFVYNGVRFFSSGTFYGDGSFRDDNGNVYWVDAGLIGCFPMDALPKGAGTVGGNVIDFPDDFDCFVCDSEGVITIGHLCIETDPTGEE